MRYIQLSALLAISCVFVGCTPSSSSSVAKAEPRRAEAEVRTADPVIEVSTAEEFVKAIGPDRTIRLTPGKIILSDVSDRQMKYVRWDQNFDGKTLTIRHVKNLKIVGPQKQRAELLVRPRYAFVLNFEDCHDVTLRHVVLGHAPEQGVCASGVIGIKNGRNFSFQHCDLFGCGTEGLTLEKVQGLRFEHSIIRDCSYGIMSAKASRDLVFRSSRFTNNREFWGVQLNDCRDVLFEACVFTGNELDGPLFSSTSSSEIHIRNGAIANNKVSALCPPGSPIKLQNVARTLDRP